MNTSVGIASVLLGFSLALSVQVGPAAAGRDSNGTATAAHTQGRSPSDPDGLSNGGADKPGHAGGWSEDRDGNNGCGNDDDREDDNNGWCGRRGDKRAEPAAAPSAVTVAASPAGTAVAATELAGNSAAAGSVEAAGISDPLAPVSGSAPATPVPDVAAAPSDPSGAEVLGAQEERDGSSGPVSLPRTGAGLLVPVAAGAALAGAGATLRRFSRRG